MLDPCQEAKLKESQTQDNRKPPPTTNQYSTAQCGELRGMSGNLDEPCRDPLTERVRQQFHRSASEARKADRMSELLNLLEKNPAAARILDLIEEVKY